MLDPLMIPLVIQKKAMSFYFEYNNLLNTISKGIIVKWNESDLIIILVWESSFLALCMCNNSY
jgi:hypothetical protein